MAAVVAAAVTDIKATRWAFLADYFLEWLNMSSCNLSESRTRESTNFGSLTVYASGDAKSLVRIRYATQLVASMLLVDQEAWWFLRASHRPWYRWFNPTVYHKATLTPKIMFAPRSLFTTKADDNLEGMQRLRTLLCGHDDASARAFQAAQAEIQQNHDPDNKLRDFTLPIKLTLRPEEPSTPETLQAYVRCLVEIVEGVQRQRKASGSKYPFRLEHIHLTLFLIHLNSIQADLRRLVSFGVPVDIHIRHLVRHFRDIFMCPQSGHITAALAENPHPVVARAPLSQDGILTLEQERVRSSCELWSAVAFAPSLRSLALHYKRFEDPVERVNQVKWLSFALRNGCLRSLTMTLFEPELEDMVAFRAIADSPDPVRLLGSSSPQTTESKDGPQAVNLKANAKIKTASGQLKTPADLCIGADWRLPVVATDSQTKRVEFVVPGYAVCSAPLSDVASIDSVAPPPTMKSRGDNGLRTIHISSWYQHNAGLAARFIENYGQSLRHLRWDGNENCNFADDAPFDEDLQVALSTCPHLEKIHLYYRRLHSLQTILRHYEIPRFRLSALKLDNAPVPPQELIQLFTHLANPRNRLAQTLESFEFKSYWDDDAEEFVSFDEEFISVDAAVIDAALAMLGTNRTLSFFSLGIASSLWEAHHRRFDAEMGVRTTKRLPLGEKLAFLSVTRPDGSLQDRAIQRLDSACVSMIFDFFTHSTTRVIALQMQ